LIVKPRYKETLQTLVKTTLHYINPREYLLPQVDPTDQPKPSKHLSKFWSFFSSKSPKKASICEPTKPIDIEAPNPVSVMLAMAQRIDLDANI